MPEMGCMLVSATRLAQNDVSTLMKPSGCVLATTKGRNHEIALILRRDNLCYLKAEPDTSHHVLSAGRDNDQATIDKSHVRLAHLGKDRIKCMMKSGDLTRLQDEQSHCETCSEGKQVRNSFSGKFRKGINPGDVIQSDVVGPLYPSHRGFTYICTFIDECSCFVSIFPVNEKSTVLSSFERFKRHFERKHNTKVKGFHSHNGGEYEPILKYAEKISIDVTRSAPCSPQANGKAERMNRTLLKSMRTLKASGLGEQF